MEYDTVHKIARYARDGGGGGRGRGGHRHLQIGRMLDSDRIPDLRSEGVKDRTFLKKAKIVSSTAIIDVEGGTFTLSM
jgi:hypothetical protein